LPQRPPGWRPFLNRLINDNSIHALGLRVTGAVAWPIALALAVVILFGR
jgi:hypothetical protein